MQPDIPIRWAEAPSAETGRTAEQRRVPEIRPEAAARRTAAARRAEINDTPIVTLATAHPAKFPDAVERATGQRPSLPARMGDLFDREERYAELPGTFDAVTDYIAERATAR